MDERTKLHTLMVETIADERNHGLWTYRAIRPLTVPDSWRPGKHVVGDCSKGVQYLCRWAGAPDPMGNHFSEYGNSTTICLHLHHVVSAAELAVGDIVTFGINGDEHATMVMETGLDPLLWSFGHQGAPNSYRLSWDRRVHQFLQLPIPVPRPTPDERLRARTGWFAWVAWWLGEGDWRSKGKSNPKVRPNVPKVIPAGWWLRLAKFLVARNSGNKPTTEGIGK